MSGGNAAPGHQEVHLLAAAVLGMVRAATISVRSATMAEAVPRQIRDHLRPSDPGGTGAGQRCSGRQPAPGPRSWSASLAGNAAVGAGTGWVVATQTTFANLAPPDRMGQVTAVVVASLVMLEGAGVLGFGMVAGRWGVGAAYLTIGMVLLATGVVAEWRGPTDLP